LNDPSSSTGAFAPTPTCYRRVLHITQVEAHPVQRATSGDRSHPVSQVSSDGQCARLPEASDATDEATGMTARIESDYETGWREGYEAASGLAEDNVIRLTDEVERLQQDLKLALDERDRLRAVLEEVKSCGHWSDCPAGFSTKYRCRCAYGIIAETLA